MHGDCAPKYPLANSLLYSYESYPCMMIPGPRQHNLQLQPRSCPASNCLRLIPRWSPRLAARPRGGGVHIERQACSDVLHLPGGLALSFSGWLYCTYSFNYQCLLPCHSNGSCKGKYDGYGALQTTTACSMPTDRQHSMYKMEYR